MGQEDTDPKTGDEPAGDGQPEKIEISKSELEKLQKKSKDFDGRVEANKNKKREGRTIPGAEPIKKEQPSDDDGVDDDNLTEEFITKKDFLKGIEKSAVKEASKDPEVDENWDSIVEFYSPRHGKETVEDILTDIEIARKTWKAQQPASEKPKEDDADQKVKSDLAKDSGLGKGKDKESKPEHKSILPKNEKMEDWYGK